MAKTTEEQLGVSLPEPTPEPEPAFDHTAPVEAAAEPERPEWLPEKFGRPEELVRSYGDLERRLTAEAQSRSALETQMAALQEQVESAQAAPTADWADQRTQLEEAYENDPLGTMAWLATQAAQQTAQQFSAQARPDALAARGQAEQYAYLVDQQMASRHEDWGDYRDKVGDLLQELPHLLPEAGLASPVEAIKGLDTALEIVRNRESATQAPAQTHDTGRRQKLAAQTMAGAAGRSAASGSEETPLHEQIKKAYQGTSWAATRGS